MTAFSRCERGRRADREAYAGVLEPGVKRCGRMGGVTQLQNADHADGVARRRPLPWQLAMSNALRRAWDEKRPCHPWRSRSTGGAADSIAKRTSYNCERPAAVRC